MSASVLASAAAGLEAGPAAADAPLLVVPLVAALAFGVYHFGARRLAAASALDPARRFALDRALGALLLGGLPGVAGALLLEGGLAAHGLGASGPLASALPASLLAPLLALPLLPLLWVAGGRPAHQARYPLLRAPCWGPHLALLHAAGWAAYLLGYELLFRGLLLFALAHALGPWPALGLSTALDVLAHLDKDPGEYLGCVPMGLLFGLMALGTGSVLAPFLLHLSIALLSEHCALRRNPAFALRAPVELAPAQSRPSLRSTSS